MQFNDFLVNKKFLTRKGNPSGEWCLGGVATLPGDALCVIFTILVSFLWDNALFASKAKINIFWIVVNGVAPKPSGTF